MGLFMVMVMSMSQWSGEACYDVVTAPWNVIIILPTFYAFQLLLHLSLPSTPSTPPPASQHISGFTFGGTFFYCPRPI